MVNAIEAAQFGRLFAAMPSPVAISEGGQDLVGSMVESYIQSGIEGVYCCGSSGEGLLLSDHERKLIVGAAVRSAAGRIPVIAHVGALSTENALGLAESAEDEGASAISAIPPIYYRYSGQAIVKYYLDILAHSNLPMIIYFVPQFTGQELDRNILSELLDEPRIVGLKYTDHNMFTLERLKNRFPDKVFINGFDETFASASMAGAGGAIGTTIGFQFPLFKWVRRALEIGDIEEAKSSQSSINRVVDELVRIGVFPAAKYVSGKLSVGKLGDCRPPFLPLTQPERSSLDRLVEQIVRQNAAAEVKLSESTA